METPDFDHYPTARHVQGAAVLPHLLPEGNSSYELLCGVGARQLAGELVN